MKILVADDDPVFREGLRGLLCRWGHEVVEVDNGQEAERLLLEPDGPAVALLDWVMPERSGLEVCRDISARGSGGVYMILVTANTGQEDMLVAFEAGIDDFLAKPVAAPELRARLQAAERIVTLQVKLQERARIAEERYGTLYAALNEGMALCEVVYGVAGRAVDFRILDVNAAWETVTGIPQQTAVGETTSRLFGARAQTFFDIFARVAESGVPESSGIYYPPTDRHLKVSVFRPGPGQVASVLTDISSIKRAEEALRESDENLRLLEKTVPGVLWLSTPDIGQMQYVSANFEEFWGRSVESLFDNPLSFLDSIHPEDRPRVTKALEGHARGEYDVEYRVIDANGAIRWIHDQRTPLRDTTGRIVRMGGVAMDVSARKEGEVKLREAEGQLRQAQKMEAVGRLAGGVAHDFNNLLQAMLTTVQVLGATTGDLHERGRIKEIEDLVGRGAQLTRQLLLFSRQEKIAPRRLDLNELVREASKMLRRLLRENIRLDLQLGDRPVFIQADRGQLDQVLMNLVVNAADAMPEGGAITISTGRHDAESVCLTVADSGHGIQPELLDRIFEPFFTTKGANKGTGLGLSVVHGIVGEHGGHIEVASEAGVGTTFRIVLPLRASGEHPAVHEEVAADGELPQGHGERVLVVEDEKEAREGLVEVLTMLGYRAIPAGSGEEAGALPAETAPDLLLTDLMLPGIAGPDLARGLVDRWPKLRVVLMSGYTEDEAVRRGASEGSVRFLQKPFGMEALARELRAALAG